MSTLAAWSKAHSFSNLRDAGDPAELAAAHAAAGADEIVLLDITATHEKRTTLLETVRRTAKEIFIPFTVGGGVRALQDAAAIFDAGADKISINSAALADPSLITCIAERFGSQAVIVAIDAKRSEPGSRHGPPVAVNLPAKMRCNGRGRLRAAAPEKSCLLPWTATAPAKDSTAR